MFKKALAHQSNATPIRSSARRGLVGDIFASYPSFPPPRTADETPEQIAEREKAERELGKLILPEGIRVVSIETSGGTEGALYLSPDNGNPLWMSFGRNSKELIPTLYALFLPLPRPPLPIIKLHHPLPPPLFTGAPLFIGAVRNLTRPWLLPDVPEGGVVAFVTAPKGDQDDDVQYVGVGRLVANGGMQGAWERRDRIMRNNSDEEEGKFCEILCIMGDHLWEMGSKPAMPTFTLPPPVKPLVPPPAEAGPSQSAPPSSTTDTLAEELDSKSLNDTSRPTSAGDSVGPLSPAEISTLLSSALIQSLSSLPPSAFPLPASSLYSAHILPNRPAYIPREQRDDVVIGKSEWKKLAKWMKEVSKEGIVKTKEIKGEVTVMGYDPAHPSIDGHVPFLTIAEEEAKAAKKAARETAAAELQETGMVNTAKGKQLAIEELWRPSGAGVAFWESLGVTRDSQNPAATLKPLAEGYIAKRLLAVPDNQRLVWVDEELGSAIGLKLAEKVTREEILKRLRAGVVWSVSIGGHIKKGALQPINLSVKTRQGRKMVTIISGLEAFAIDVDDFAEEMRKACAGSASIQPQSGTSPKLNLKEIVVQGMQTKIITESLMAKGVPRRWIKDEGEGKKK